MGMTGKTIIIQMSEDICFIGTIIEDEDAGNGVALNPCARLISVNVTRENGTVKAIPTLSKFPGTAYVNVDRAMWLAEWPHPEVLDNAPMDLLFCKQEK